MRIASISIDLDSIYCYQRIYGLPPDETDNIIYEVGLERFTNLMEDYGLKATLFVVGRDVAMGDNRRILRYLSDQGFEIANHSLSHDYRLTRLVPDEMAREVSEGKKAIEAVTGVEVDGFRAPGYNVNEALLDAIERSGHRYDSSVFPCLPYYATKAAVLAVMKLGFRESRSILGGPQVLAAPRRPYHPHPKAYWRTGKRRLWELPISTSPVLRFPFLGSFITMMGEGFFPYLFSMLKSQPCLVLEFHGMDFMDGWADGLEAELLKQPDVAKGWEVKERLFRSVLEDLKARGPVVPLREAVDILESEAMGG